MKRAVVAHEPRSEVRHLCAGAVLSDQDRLEDAGIANIIRCRRDLSFEDDVAKSLFFIACEQAAENRIAVEAGKTPPDDAAALFYERSDAAIADCRNIERRAIWTGKYQVPPGVGVLKR